MKKVVFVLLFMLFPALGFCQDQKLSNEYTINEFNLKAPSYGTYHVTGYVSKIFQCPPCPEGAQCKPCMAQNIIISEKKKTVKDYSRLSGRDMIIFCDDTSLFQLKSKYKFLIQVMNFKTTDQPINNVKLIYSEEL